MARANGDCPKREMTGESDAANGLSNMGTETSLLELRTRKLSLTLTRAVSMYIREQKWDWTRFRREGRKGSEASRYRALHVLFWFFSVKGNRIEIILLFVVSCCCCFLFCLFWNRNTRACLLVRDVLG